MKTDRINSRSLLKLFATLALIGPIDPALGSSFLEESDSMDSNSTSAPTEEYPWVLPAEMLRAIALELDLPTLLNMMEADEGLYEILSEEGFQENYKQNLATQLSELFRNDFSTQFQETFLGGPLYTLGRDLISLMAPENLTLLNWDNRLLLNSILNPDVIMEFPQRFMISSYASQFFTEEMGKPTLSPLITQLANLSVDRIVAISSYADQFFTKKMNGYERSYIISVLAKISVDQIAAVALQAPVFFIEENTGYGRAEIIEALRDLSVEKIAAVASILSDLDDKSVKNILYTIRNHYNEG